MELPTGNKPLNDLVGMKLEEVERVIILETLNRNGWNRTQAAKVLGICVRTLRSKLKKFKNDSELDAQVAA